MLLSYSSMISLVMSMLDEAYRTGLALAPTSTVGVPTRSRFDPEVSLWGRRLRRGREPGVVLLLSTSPGVFDGRSTRTRKCISGPLPQYLYSRLLLPCSRARSSSGSVTGTTVSQNTPSWWPVRTWSWKLFFALCTRPFDHVSGWLTRV